ncbi:polysaccharide deacetylase family protein [Actinomycetospora termitidis]|uniref:Polysaccharide deacetylase family protein n=1 Tax=Actinomycetospora termitidis TaxID=3053470 RepID=A0ABT7M4S2_9PSEU|nr:polysaccharide deacetylase family protein [Actinomycetospora sp. Odt1-22]MDL5155680.1 polysaccharide deacetylase family protein [Actinomycetospora sp. Odt1-22]
MGNRLLVLGWHNIDPTPGFPDPPGVGRLGFAKQLRMLSRFANVLPLQTALGLMEAGEPLPSRAVVLTFDDGYRDNLELGVPMLERHGLPATFFLVPGFLSGTVGAWWEDLSSAFDRARASSLEFGGTAYPLSTPAERETAHAAVRGALKTLDHASRVAEVARVSALLAPAETSVGEGLFMDWSGAKSLLAAGHEIGSHTVSHAILERESESGQRAELGESRAALESGLGITVDTLAFPNGSSGDYSDVTTRVAAEAGYRCAVTTTAGLASGKDSPYEMRRVVVTPTTDLASVAEKGWRKARGVIGRRVAAVSARR